MKTLWLYHMFGTESPTKEHKMLTVSTMAEIANPTREPTTPTNEKNRQFVLSKKHLFGQGAQAHWHDVVHLIDTQQRCCACTSECLRCITALRCLEHLWQQWSAWVQQDFGFMVRRSHLAVCESTIKLCSAFQITGTECCDVASADAWNLGD